MDSAAAGTGAEQSNRQAEPAYLSKSRETGRPESAQAVSWPAAQTAILAGVNGNCAKTWCHHAFPFLSVVCDSIRFDFKGAAVERRPCYLNRIAGQ